MPPANNQRVRVRKGRPAPPRWTGPSAPTPRRRGYAGFDSDPYHLKPATKAIKRIYHSLNPFD